MREVWDFFIGVSLVWLGKLLPIRLKQPNAPTLRNPDFIAPKVSHFVPLQVKNHLRGPHFPDLSKYQGFCQSDGGDFRPPDVPESALKAVAETTMKFTPLYAVSYWGIALAVSC